MEEDNPAPIVSLNRSTTDSRDSFRRSVEIPEKSAAILRLKHLAQEESSTINSGDFGKMKERDDSTLCSEVTALLENPACFKWLTDLKSIIFSHPKCCSLNYDIVLEYRDGSSRSGRVQQSGFCTNSHTLYLDDIPVYKISSKSRIGAGCSIFSCNTRSISCPPDSEVCYSRIRYSFVKGFEQYSGYRVTVAEETDQNLINLNFSILTRYLEISRVSGHKLGTIRTRPVWRDASQKDFVCDLSFHHDSTPMDRLICIDLATYLCETSLSNPCYLTVTLISLIFVLICIAVLAYIWVPVIQYLVTRRNN